MSTFPVEVTNAVMESGPSDIVERSEGKVYNYILAIRFRVSLALGPNMLNGVRLRVKFGQVESLVPFDSR